MSNMSRSGQVDSSLGLKAYQRGVQNCVPELSRDGQVPKFMREGNHGLKTQSQKAAEVNNSK